MTGKVTTSTSATIPAAAGMPDIIFPAAPSRKPKAAPRSHPTHPSPNYATREETMKVARRIMEERAEVFRRLADA